MTDTEATMYNNFIRRRCVRALTLLTLISLVGAGYSLRSVAEEQDPRQPTLSDLMTLAQLRHFKLWYAHKEDNWKLAGYGIGSIQIDD